MQLVGLSQLLRSYLAMEAAESAANCESKGAKEGRCLLGEPTFEEVGNEKFRCVETGHELPSMLLDSYSRSKKCRLGLIDHALSLKIPPLNVFKQDPVSRSKLICKLTGDTVNKSEEHIWKHVNGKRFLNKLGLKESGKITQLQNEGDERFQEVSKTKVGNGNAKKKCNKSNVSVEEIVSKPRELSDEEPHSLDCDFWMPPVGNRWDQDGGGDRWSSASGSDLETCECDAEIESESIALSTRAKRMSLETGPSRFASRKKKKVHSME